MLPTTIVLRKHRSVPAEAFSPRETTRFPCEDRYFPSVHALLRLVFTALRTNKDFVIDGHKQQT